MPDYDWGLDEEQFVTGVGINVTDPMRVERYAQHFQRAKQLDANASIEKLKVVTWEDANQAYLFALKLERFAMSAVLMLVVLVAAFSISGTMMMMVFYKKSQVALLRALGMRRRDIVRMFLVHGLTIGSIVIVSGLTLGLLFCGFIILAGRFELLLLPSVYFLDAIPVEFIPLDYLVICGAAWALSLLAAVYPAWLAAAQLPSASLRHE